MEEKGRKEGMRREVEWEGRRKGNGGKIDALTLGERRDAVERREGRKEREKKREKCG